MKPIVLFKDENDKIVITAEEIEKLVEDAYNAGYNNGYYNGTATLPYYTPSYEPTWWKDHVVITRNTASSTL